MYAITNASMSKFLSIDEGWVGNIRLATIFPTPVHYDLLPEVDGNKARTVSYGDYIYSELQNKKTA